MSPKRILNVYFPYLPKCTEFLLVFRKEKKPVSKFRLNRRGSSIEGV